MLLDIRKLFASYDAPVVRKLNFDFTNEDFPGYTVENPVQAEFSATLEGSTVRLEVSVQAKVHAACARCLDEVQQTFAFARTFFIRDEEWTKEDTELPLAPDGKLDVQELVYTELVLEVPSVLLCKDTCEGLCPVCGNRKPCPCGHETNGAVDERLSILKQLLSE